MYVIQAIFEMRVGLRAMNHTHFFEYKEGCMRGMLSEAIACADRFPKIKIVGCAAYLQEDLLLFRKYTFQKCE